MATAVECEGEAEKRRRLLLRTGGRGGAATVAAEGMGTQKRGRDRRQRSLPHALPSRAAPLDLRRLGPCREIRGETTAGSRRPAPARLARAVARSILLLAPSISASPARPDVGEEGSERKQDGGARAGGEVRTKSWAGVEAGRGVWGRGGVRRVGGARRAGQKRRQELGGELVGGGKGEGIRLQQKR